MRNIPAFITAFGLAFVSVAQAQQHEVLATVSHSADSNIDHDKSMVQGTIRGQLSFNVPVLGTWDVGGAYGYSNFPRAGTPGGHRTVKSLFVRKWFGPNIFVGLTGDRIFGDATIWTKEVDFFGGFAGVRIRSRKYGDENRIWLSYRKEVRTDAIAPNRTEVFGLRWSYDFNRLPGPLFVRVNVGYSYERFLQNGERWSSHGTVAGIGIGLKAPE